jgi:hypothetical protein
VSDGDACKPAARGAAGVAFTGFSRGLFVLLGWAWDYLFYERASRLITDE